VYTGLVWMLLGPESDGMRFRCDRKCSKCVHVHADVFVHAAFGGFLGNVT